jgi:hypothetical protein
MFQNKAFGPFLPQASPQLDYTKTHCPNSDLLCQQCIWLEQAMLLGPQQDMDDIAAALEKIHRNAGALRDWEKGQATGTSGTAIGG